MCKNRGFRSRIQKSYNIFGIHSKFITPPHCFLGLTQIAQISLSLWAENLTEVGGWEISRMLCSFASKGSHRFNEIQQDDYLWEFVLIRGKKIFVKKLCE